MIISDEEFSDDLSRIANWTDTSKRQKIETSPGSRYQFFLEKRYTKQEIERIQSTYCLNLPNEFQQFLEVVGCGHFFAIPYTRGVSFTRRTGIHVLDIEFICRMLPKISNAPLNDMFKRYLPLGTDFNQQKAIVLDQTGDGNILFQSSLPDDWPSFQPDTEPGISLKQWVQNMVRCGIPQNSRETLES